MKKILLMCLMIMFSMNVTFAAKKILYIPLDNRPCNLKQVVEVAEMLDYEMITPPVELIGRGAEEFGEPDKLWTWLYENSAGIEAAVISSDSMFYGGLVASRKHEFSAAEIMNRAKRFEEYKNKFPYLPIYVFGTIMRTPTYATTDTEPDYFKKYGGMIVDYTRLKNKAEVEGLSRSEKKNLERLQKELPAEYLEDWLNRRGRNYNASKYLVDLARNNSIQYFFLGCDDSAQYSQTQAESRHLAEYGKDLGKTVFQVTSGADELGMLMVSRAINKNMAEIPFVAVGYNEGVGKNTIPRCCNGKIGSDISAAIIAAGGLEIPAPERADLVLAVNTNHNGKTFEASDPKNKITPRRGTRTFKKLLNSYLEKNYPVGVVDIATANGSDNALMNYLNKNNLQFKIRAYGGWNTATNSAGFLIGSGVLTNRMNEHEKNRLLLTRYFDDWIYQANIRPQLANGLIWTVPGEGGYWKLNDKRAGLEKLTGNLVKNFAIENIHADVRNITAEFTWNRCFECDFSFDY